MKYRVIEDLDAPPEQRYVVESTIYGHTWGRRSFFADQLSAEIEMERRAAGPRVIAVAHCKFAVGVFSSVNDQAHTSAKSLTLDPCSEFRSGAAQMSSFASEHCGAGRFV